MNMEKDVPYIVYESEAARHERTVRRLLIALLLTIILRLRKTGARAKAL